MLQEFKSFIQRGNVLDLAVGIIIGLAFSAVVNSLVNDLLMPPLGLVLKGVDFSNLFLNLTPAKYSGSSLADAKKAGAATLNYGLFINNVISILIIAFAVFMIVKNVNRFLPRPVALVSTKKCAYCLMLIPAGAIRCPHCTSNLS